MVNKVQEHIDSLNSAYVAELGDKQIFYFNSYASFVDANTV